GALPAALWRLGALERLVLNGVILTGASWQGAGAVTRRSIRARWEPHVWLFESLDGVAGAVLLAPFLCSLTALRWIDGGWYHPGGA
ncbi:unnamed protein product, partial [Scytosiphon promiscuus]